MSTERLKKEGNIYALNMIVTHWEHTEVVEVLTFCTEVEVQLLVGENTLVKVQVLIQLLYLSKSKKVQLLNCNEVQK